MVASFLTQKKRVIEKGFSKFDLIIDLQTKFRNSLILKKIPHNSFLFKDFKWYFFQKKKLNIHH